MNAPAWENPVNRCLLDGRPAVGVTITTGSLDAVLEVARAGFDFLWIDMEHAPVTLETLRHIVLATRALPAVPFARVPVNELWTAKRVLDAGVCGVIFPFTSSPALAEQAVAACRYPPAGRRGSGAGLASACWPDPAAYYDSADRNVAVVAVVEDVAALECIDAIAATPGIDVLFVGTSDLSFSLGLRGRQDEPELERAIETIAAAAQRHGKALGRPAATSADVARYSQQGFLLFQAPSDLRLLAAGAARWLEPLRSGGRGPSQVLY